MSERKIHLNQAEFLEAYALETAAKMEQMKLNHANGPHRVSTLWDKDENLFDTVRAHVRYINKMATRIARMKGIKYDLPDYDTVVAHGGTAMYAKIFGITPEIWEEMHERERSTKAINSGAPPYTPNLAALMEVAAQRSNFLGYLTATPIGHHRPITREGEVPRFFETQRYVEEDIWGRGLPIEPVILRPATVPARDAAAWKSGFMSEIQSAEPKTPVILIDDSLSTADRLARQNEQREPGTLPLFQIVMSEGTLTQAKVKSGAAQERPELGIYISDWENLPDTISKIEQTWNPKPQQ